MTKKEIREWTEMMDKLLAERGIPSEQALRTMPLEERLRQSRATLSLEIAQIVSEEIKVFGKEKRILKVIDGSPKQQDLAEKVNEKARVMILRQLPNLQSLSINGKNVSFPFCFKIGKEAKPASGLLNPLKIIIFRGTHGPQLSTTNIFWLLSLPNVFQASLLGLLDDQDANFLKSKFNEKGSTNFKVKHLELVLRSIVTEAEQDP